MMSEVAIRDALERRATTFAPPAPVDIDEIVGGANQRRRRARFGGTLASLLVAAFVIVGVGTAFGGTTDDDVFAADTTEGALADENLVPWQVVFDGERFVALATDGDDWVGEQSPPIYAVATSPDGASWQGVEGAPLFEGPGVLLAEHAGEYLIVFSTVDSPDKLSDGPLTQELVVATSDDLVEWRQREHAIPTGLAGDGEVLQPAAVVAWEAGVVVQTSTMPSRQPQFREALEALGYEPDALCDLIWQSGSATFRKCGTTENGRVDVDIELASPRNFAQHLFFAPHGESMELVPFPPADNWRSLPGGTLLYTTPSGFGLQGPSTYESDDPPTLWARVEVWGEQGAMVAARGADRVFRSNFPVTRFGPDAPTFGMGIGTVKGDWEEIALDELYGDQLDSPRWYAGLQAGPAGWTVIAQRSFTSRPEILGVERDRSGESDFVLTSSSGYILTGTYPFGAATLVEPGGAIVQEWDQLEVANPEWSGFEIGVDGVVWRDDATGEELARFTLRQWSAVLEPLGLLEYDLLFSPDGRDWQILETFESLPEVLAIGDDELVVRERYALQYVFSESDVRSISVEPPE